MTFFEHAPFLPTPRIFVPTFGSFVNCCENNFRDPPGGSSDEAEGNKKSEKDDCCPWESPLPSGSAEKRKKIGIAVTAGSMASEDVWESETGPCLIASELRVSRKNSSQMDSGSSSSELSLAIVEVSERLRRSCGIVQQSSLPANEETKTRKLSTTSTGKNESRRSSIAAPRSISDGNAKISPDGCCTGLEPKSKTPESTRPSVSSTEDVAVVTPITAAASLPHQVTAVPQQPPVADTPSEKSKDNNTDSETLRTNKKSQSGARKRSSISAAPLISVSSVVEDVSDEKATSAPLATAEDILPQDAPDEAAEAAEGETSAEGDPAGEPSAESTTGGKPKDPVVCPWEDE